MTKVAHLTTVHAPFDNRIFHKECKSLARAGYEVVLVATADAPQIIEGVRLAPIRKQRNRLLRRTFGVWQCLCIAMHEDAALYHIHDPELLPVALLLRLRGKPVIYDIHEDYVTSIRQSPVLPRWLAAILATICGIVEPLLAAPLTQVIAERYYANRFPGATPILNYPDLRNFDFKPVRTLPLKEPRLLYTGTVGVDRGALLLANLCNLMPDVQIDVVGRCTAALAERMYAAAGEGRNRLSINGIDMHVPFSAIVEAYRTESYLAGMAIFPETPHYASKELTKFYEYMAAGLPVICSNFPIWSELVASNGVGICVSPIDVQSQVDAIRLLVDAPELAMTMGMNGRKAVEERYNWQIEEEKLLGLYKTILGEKK